MPQLQRGVGLGRVGRVAPLQRGVEGVAKGYATQARNAARSFARNLSQRLGSGYQRVPASEVELEEQADTDGGGDISVQRPRGHATEHPRTSAPWCCAVLLRYAAGRSRQLDWQHRFGPCMCKQRSRSCIDVMFAFCRKPHLWTDIMSVVGDRRERGRSSRGAMEGQGCKWGCEAHAVGGGRALANPSTVR